MWNLKSEICDFKFEIEAVQKGGMQGRSERKPEAYGSRYVEGLSEARTLILSVSLLKKAFSKAATSDEARRTLFCTSSL